MKIQVTREVGILFCIMVCALILIGSVYGLWHLPELVEESGGWEISRVIAILITGLASFFGFICVAVCGFGMAESSQEIVFLYKRDCDENSN